MRRDEVHAYLFIILCIIVLMATWHKAHGEEYKPEVAAWFNSLRQPDAPEYSCCGVSDVDTNVQVRPIDVSKKLYEVYLHGIGWRLWPPTKVMYRIDNPLGRNIAFYQSGYGVLHFYCLILSSGS